MNINKPTNKWVIDLFLLIGFLLSFYLNVTGVIIHQWLGVVVIFLAGVHLMMHWNWVKSVTARFVKGTNSRSRLFYVIDFLIMLGAVTILETGLMISTWFNLALSNYSIWVDIHIYSAITVLALAVLKIGLHWRWVVNTTKKVFSFQTTSLGRLKPVPVEVEPTRRRLSEDREAVDRRQFLSAMGLVGLGSLLAVSNVFSDGKVAWAEAADDPNFISLPTGANAVTPQPAAAASTSTVQPTRQAATITLEDEPTVTVAPTQTVAQENIVPVASDTSTYCTIQCRRGCSFPGHCRRYTDANGNGKCDLGECI